MLENAAVLVRRSLRLADAFGHGNVPSGALNDGAGVEDRAFGDDNDAIPDGVRVEVSVLTRDRIDPDPAVVADAGVLVDDGPLDDAPLTDADVRLPFARFLVLRGLVEVRPHADH